jgi:hypothetical protein
MIPMKKVLFIQGGGNGGYETDKKLVSSLKIGLVESSALHMVGRVAGAPRGIAGVHRAPG